jgi:hypothetical protein
MTETFGPTMRNGQFWERIMISNFVSNIAESSLLRTFNSTTDILEISDLFGLHHQKCLIKRKKLSKLKNRHRYKNIFVISNLSTYHNIDKIIKGRDVINIFDKEFLKSNFDFNESLILLTNNNLAQIGPADFSRFIEQFESSVVAVHDFDNHHWHHLSIACAVVADVYVPAHLSSNIIQSRINPNIDISLPCGTIQWTRELLFNHLEKIFNLNRSKNPLGMHNFYEKFKYRNSVISTLGKNIPSVQINLENFHIRSADDRFNEWASHSCHWIIPVHNDLPIRFFDALITGGIPIIPSSLVQQMEYFKIPAHFYVTHDALDILEPTEVIQRANDLFEKHSVEGILERFQFCLDNYHVNSIALSIIEHCEKKYLQGTPT